MNEFYVDTTTSPNITALEQSYLSTQTSENLTVIDPFYLLVYDWTRHSATLFVCVSFLLGVPGNCLVIIVHGRVNRTVTDLMIMYIAVCDIMSLINVPLYFLQLQNLWPLGVPEFFCKYHFFNLNSVSMASYMFCACTAIERFYKVVHSKEIFSMNQTKFLWIPIFIISFSIGSLVIFAVHNNLNNNCMYDLNRGRFLATSEYAFLLFVALGSTIVMIVCYLRTGLFLLMKTKEISSSNKSFKKSYNKLIQTTKMLAVVTLVFLFSANVPYVIGVIMTIHQPTKEPEMSVMFILSISFFFNNFFNPFLYIAMSTSFRRRSKHLFASCCRCCFSKYVVENKIELS